MIDFTISPWFYLFLVWTLIWKAVASWKAARKGHLFWFILFFVVNTFGLLPIFYVLFFQKMKFSEKFNKKRTNKKSKKNPVL